MSSTSLRILTFNVWDIPVAQHRAKRIEGLVRVLRENKDQVDVVGLLECWLESDRNQLIAAGKEGGLGHHVFFRNGCGFPGGDSSGLVVLSRWPIENCFYHRFTAAGKAQKILHWDYSMYSGKGIGVAHISGPPEVGKIDFFISHFVAYYTPKPEDPQFDEYVYHRRLGAWEAAQFIRATAREDSFVACCVDLNADPTTLTYRCLVGMSGLRDAWVESGRARKGALPDALNEVEAQGLTVNYPGNCYFENNAWIASGEPSARVDYILHSASTKLVPEWCERRFSGPEDADSIVSLSDHSAVLASFRVSLTEQPKAVDTKEDSGRAARSPLAKLDCRDTMLSEMARSAEAGIASALARRRKALNKSWVFALISLLALAIPQLVLGASGVLWVLAQFLLCGGFALSAYSYFILANITIPDEESAMLFMLSSVRFQQGAVEEGVASDLF